MLLTVISSLLALALWGLLVVAWLAFVAMLPPSILHIAGPAFLAVCLAIIAFYRIRTALRSGKSLWPGSRRG